MITAYHAKLFAHELRKRHSAADSEKLAGALLDAQADLNPHQVEAALFVFQSPLSKCAILADEVGLGKTGRTGSCSFTMVSAATSCATACTGTLS